ncbi:MAG: hypothetical protein JXB62_07380 [Pirellulales bacterium]|nr:hypothetical protein [Pirellulales bacterium]
MNKLRILLSFDHELSLGGARSYAKNLFEPTDRVLDLATDLGAPITLFTDVCCAIRFREWEPEGFYKAYCDQIRRALRSGHDVQLHLHPHWIDSTYKDGKFTPAKTYSLGCFRDRPWPDDIAGIVKRGIDLLEELCGDERPGYACIAYRAGGFCLSPHTASILSALYDHGIRIESSIAKGNYFASELWRVDHRRMPGKANWCIAPSGPLDREASGGLYEIPIAARPRTPLNNLPFLFKRVWRRGRSAPAEGWAIDEGNTAPLDKVKRMFPHSAWMLGFDNFTHGTGDLMKILRRHIDAHRDDELIACSALSHPKHMGEYARSLMKDFVHRVRREYGERAEFCSYQQFYDEFLADRDEAKTTATPL